MQASLLTKVILALVLVGLVPLAWVTFRLVKINREAFTEQVLRLHAVNASASSTRIHGFLLIRRQMARAAANHPALADPQSAETQELLKSLLAADETIQALSAGVFTQDGRAVLRAQHPDIPEVAIEALSTATQPLSLVQADSVLYLIVVEEVAAVQAQVRALFNAQPLLEYLQPKELGQNAHMAIVDSQGQPLMTSQEAGPLPSDLVLQTNSGQVSGAGKYTGVGGSRLLGAFAPVGLASWTIASWQPIQIAESVALNMRNHALIAAGFALLLVAVLTLFAFRTVIGPLRALIAENASLSGTEAGGDEIGALRQAFAALRQHVAEKKSLADVALGRYHVIRQIGAGAMGTVFQGWDPKLKRPVALKTIKLDDGRAGATHQHSSQLVREAVSAASVRHDHVVSVYDVEDTPDFAFVAMEFIEGDTLEGYIQRNGHLSEGEAVLLGLAVAKGLLAAHDKRIVHRDIKPANVLLGHEGEVKISDFGISELMTSLTAKNDQVFGTPGYLPPETICGNGFSDRGDMFALGVLMYECVTGKIPFTGATVREVMMNTLRADPTPPKVINPKIGDLLNQTILRLIDKQPDNRPTATDLIEILTNMAPQGSWVYRNDELEEIDEASLLPTHAGLSSQLVDTVDLGQIGRTQPHKS